MSTVTLYPSGPPTGLDLGSAGAVVTNLGDGSVSYSDTAEPFVAEGTLAATAAATLYGTQFFRATTGAVIQTSELDADLGSLEEIRAQLKSVENGSAWTGSAAGYVLTIGVGGLPVWSPGGAPAVDGALTTVAGDFLATVADEILLFI